MKTRLLLLTATAAVAASPLAARPMTARDMQSMHRVGAPEVSRDGRYAVFTISDTDWDKNKRVNTLYLLDLTREGAAPQPIAAAAKGHDAVFGPDGAIWFLMPVGEQDQLFSRFFRSSTSQERAIRGTGLGLAIVKQIVDAKGQFRSLAEP